MGIADISETKRQPESAISTVNAQYITMLLALHWILAQDHVEWVAKYELYKRSGWMGHAEKTQRVMARHSSISR